MQKERSTNTHFRQEIIKEEIVELDQQLLEAIRGTKPIDYENKLIKLNYTIGNLQSSEDAISLSQLPAIQSKVQHEGIKRTISDPTVTSQVERAESQGKQTLMHYDFHSNLNAYGDLFKEYKHTKPSILINDYAKKIKQVELTKDFVKEELRLIIQATHSNARKHGGKMKGVKKGSDECKELERKKKYLGLYRDALNTMHTAIDKLSFVKQDYYM